jgi:4-amino-4-deoxy-L-arabinose transferase
MGLQNYLKARREKAFTAGASLLAIFTALVAVSLLVIQMGDFQGFEPYAQTWKWVLLLAGLLRATVFTLCSIRASTLKKKFLLYGAAPILFMFVAPSVFADPIIAEKAPAEFLVRQMDKIRPDTILLTDETLLGAVCWFYRRSDVRLIGGAGEMGFGIRRDGAKGRLLNLEDFRKLVSEDPGEGRVALIASSKDYKEWKRNLPSPIFEEGNRSQTFAQF